MHWIDWCMVGVTIGLVVSIACYTQSYMNSVSDFLSGGRFAGRYLLAVARDEGGSGAAGFVAVCEVLMKSGFALGWWYQIRVPILLFLLIIGFVSYRYRETRVMTLAQFF